MKRITRLTESDLHRIVRESVKRVLDEAYSDAQYAHLAGQANGALNSFGGRLKGMFNPQWKKRKERQMNKFADQATHDYTYRYSSTKGGDNNFGNYVELPGHNGSFSNGGTFDYISNDFNRTGNGNKPFELKRTNYYERVGQDGKSEYQDLSHNGETYSRKEFSDLRDSAYPKMNKRQRNAWDDVSDGNGTLNRAFEQGQEARKGRTIRTFGGDTYTNGTGTSSDAFKRLK